MYVLRISENRICFAHPSDGQRISVFRMQEDALCNLPRPHIYLARD